MTNLSKKEQRKLRNETRRKIEKMSKEEIMEYLLKFMQDNQHSDDSEHRWGVCHDCLGIWWQGHKSNCKLASFLIVHGNSERVKYLEEEHDWS